MVRFLLLAQTAGSLASNPFWGRLGDAYGKLALLRAVGWLRMIPPLFAVAILALDLPPSFLLAAFSVLFFFTGALINGMAIGFLGYLLEISPNHRRPAYSGYFNALAAPAALLPLAGALISDLASLTAVFAAAIAALPRKAKVTPPRMGNYLLRLIEKTTADLGHKPKPPNKP